MTVNASKHYLNRYGVLTGQNIVIVTNNDSVYATGELLSSAGANITILDVREDNNSELNERFEVQKCSDKVW